MADALIYLSLVLAMGFCWWHVTTTPIHAERFDEEQQRHEEESHGKAKG
jgi:hypothetical protein